MARLLDLPDELLLAIVNYIQTDTNVPSFMLNISMAYQSSELFRRVAGNPPPQRIKDMLSLLLVSRRFHRISKPILYRDICMRIKAVDERLSRSPEADPSMQARVRSVIVSCRYEPILNFVHRFFWLPNIETLTILAFGNQKPVKFENSSRVGTSPVKSLNLISSAAHTDALADVLSWPAGLEVFHYDEDICERNSYPVDEPTGYWTHADFGRALQPLKATLRNLTIQACPDGGAYPLSEPCINLRDFTALTTLRVYDDFLTRDEVYDLVEVLRVLPRSLEMLEIFHATESVGGELDYVARNTIEPLLSDLLRHKEAHVPRLLSVRIITHELSWPEEGIDDPVD